MRITVPVKDRKHTGFVIRMKPETEVTRVKEIITFKEPAPIIGESFIELVKWVSEYYICGLAECFQAALPSKLISLPECHLQLDGKTKIAASEIPEQFPFETDIQQIKSGVQSGKYRVSYKRIRLLKDNEKPDLKIAEQNLVPNDSQQAAIDGILDDIGKRSIRNYLLFGVTGSGKTLVYIEIMRRLMQEGMSVLILVPEISLTPVMQKRFTDIFGDNVIVLHSRLTPAQRLRRWERARRGIGRIVLGPRSSVFVPIPNLSLIVVDEEQDHSYKQESPSPRYNARDVALMRGKIEKVPVIMGSATPSIESFHNAKNGKFELLRLPERPGGSQLPNVTVLDMKTERVLGSSLSATLVARMNDVLMSGKQVMLLLNRRGYARYARCPECGYMWRCPDCEINFTYHEWNHKLMCHYCGRTEPEPSKCPFCEGVKLSFFGTGTQRLEKTLNEIFPEMRIARMDLDSTMIKGELERIISEVTEGNINILTGTQMIGKGFDFPDIQLTGIIMTDLGLSFPDFRARETTFRLLTQAAGRAGRRKILGDVYIQTSIPDEYSIYHASRQDFEGFYREEIANRKRFHYPPYSRLILFTVSSLKQDSASKGIQSLREKLMILKDSYKGGLFLMLGPAPAPMYKRNKYFRHQLLLKLDSVTKFNELLRKRYPDAPMGIIPRDLRLAINVDPQDML